MFKIVFSYIWLDLVLTLTKFDAGSLEQIQLRRKIAVVMYTIAFASQSFNYCIEIMH